MLNSNSYKGLTNGCQGAVFSPFNSRGYTSIEVLDFLSGKPWDDVALGFCHALRPSIIRVVTNGTQLDSRTWRLTVYIDENNLIKKIFQEVEVGLPEGVRNGHELSKRIK